MAAHAWGYDEEQLGEDPASTTSPTLTRAETRKCGRASQALYGYRPPHPILASDTSSTESRQIRSSACLWCRRLDQEIRIDCLKEVTAARSTFVTITTATS